MRLIKAVAVIAVIAFSGCGPNGELPFGDKHVYDSHDVTIITNGQGEGVYDFALSATFTPEADGWNIHVRWLNPFGAQGGLSYDLYINNELAQKSVPAEATLYYTERPGDYYVHVTLAGTPAVRSGVIHVDISG